MILAKCREKKAVQGREKDIHKERLVVKVTNIWRLIIIVGVVANKV